MIIKVRFVVVLKLALLVGQSSYGQVEKTRAERIIVHNGCRGTKNTFFFSYTNMFKDEVLSPQLFSRGDTTFRGDYFIPTKQPVMVVFSADFTPYPVYAEPGDTIKVSCASDWPRYTFTGSKNRSELNFLARMEKKLGFTFPDLSGIKMTNQLDLEHYANQNKEKYEEKNSFLKRNADSLKLSPSYINTISTLLKYRYANSLLRPYFTKQSAQFDWTKIPKSYDEKLQGLLGYTKMGEVDFWPNDISSFFTNYNRFLAKDSLIKFPNHPFEVLYQSGERNFNGIARDYILFKLLKEFNSKGIKNMADYVQRYERVASRKVLAKYIDSVFQENNAELSQAAKETQLKTRKGEVITFDKILHDNQGRIMYVDFWASWCGPCIQEMPSSKSMEDKLKNEPVSFVYISIDSKSEAWLKAIDKYQINCEKCEHYLLDEKSPLAKYFSLPPIPRYLLIEKSGKIAAKNAPRPSDATLIEKVRGMLK